MSKMSQNAIHINLLHKWLNDTELLPGPLVQPNESKNSIICYCGSHYTPNSKHHHIKTKRHLEFNAKNSDITVHTTLFNKNRNVHTKGFTCNSEVIIPEGDKAVYETCVCCGIEYPLTPNYFHTEYAGHKKNNIERESGKEIFSNSRYSGCILCSKKVTEARSKTDDEIMRLMIKTNNGDLTIEWLEQQLKKQNNCCYITKLPITLERGFYNSASVQNNGEGNIHYQINCVVIMQCLQVQEHSIKNLKDAWEHILLNMKKEKESPSDTTQFLQELDIKFSNTPEQNGVTAPTQIYEDDVGSCCHIVKGKKCKRICVKYKTVCLLHLSKEEKKELNDNPQLTKQVTGIKKKMNPEYSSQCANLHLPRIIRDQVERYYASDHRSKGRKDKSTIKKLESSDILKKIHTQKGRCYISGVPFSFNRYDPNYWSLERLDNSQHHTVDNTVLVCRIMNGRTQLTKEIIQHIYNKYSSNDL
jgi:hypothetical protein